MYNLAARTGYHTLKYIIHFKPLCICVLDLSAAYWNELPFRRLNGVCIFSRQAAKTLEVFTYILMVMKHVHYSFGGVRRHTGLTAEKHMASSTRNPSRGLHGSDLIVWPTSVLPNFLIGWCHIFKQLHDGIFLMTRFLSSVLKHFSWLSIQIGSWINDIHM